MIRRMFPLSVGIAVLTVSALAGERAQSSGARKTEEDEKKAVPAQSEAERVGLMNRLLRNRQFDIFKSGNSLGGAIDVSLPTPSQTAPNIDPKLQKRLMEDLDRKKNWLVEPGSTVPRDFEQGASPDAVPDFSRDRDRSKSKTDETGRADFSRGPKRGADDITSKSDKDDKILRNKRTDIADGGSPLPISAISEKDSSDTASSWGTGRNERGDITGQNGSMERLVGTFDTGSGRIRDFGADVGSDFNALGTSSGAKEYLNPFSDPAKAQAFGNDPFSDPGQRFDPTALQQSSFGVRDDGFAKVESFVPAAPAAAGSAFDAFGAPGGGAAGGIKSFFNASAPEPARPPQQPAFTPRPAVLSFPSANPF